MGMTFSTRLATAALVVAMSSMVAAQTVDEIITKSIAAVGGRAALQKIKSRRVTGTITLGTPGGNIDGTVEIVYAAPNKSRSLITADLSALGAGTLTLDQRFDGSAGYILDSLQGNREMTGNQLDNMRNGSFPHPFLNYKELGFSAKLEGKDKVGDRDAYVIVFEPATGSTVRQYIDAETFLPIQSKVKIEVPQLGSDVEQTVLLSDYRDVDGVKIPFLMKVSSTVQNYTVVTTKVEHNVPIDEKLFAKPAAP
jgi:outer membrane lipoprotein-sorting protein